MRRYVALLALAAVLPAGCSDDGFDAERWRAASTVGCGPDNPRQGMSGELRSSLLDERPSRRRVVAMLGEPDSADDGSVDYAVGRSAIDCLSLTIEFGPDRRVSAVRDVQG